MFRFIVLLACLLVPFLNAFSKPGLPISKPEWLIDTDAGPDDALAILYLLNQAPGKVQAITIESNGSTYCETALANLKKLLQLSHQSKIPLACGRTRPLSGRHQFPKNLRIQWGQFTQVALKPLKPPRKKARELLIQILSQASKPLNILALGPLTTLAEVFEKEPSLKNKIRMIYIMGGALQVPGNIQTVLATSPNSRAEWNIYLDPEAAEKIFHSGLALTLVPLDVTNQALIDQDFYKRLQQRRKTPAADFAYSLLTHYQNLLRAHSWYFWDPMAAVIATHEELAEFKILPLSVALAPESLSGTTIIDPLHGAKIRVSLGIQVEQFKN
ncbi:MAG TPA: nucleoside hydrolase, partial [Gammaproteobacteria bacterium]|nr:nucleoside hydrolase [Gammaproteobacteria bacterium]